MRWLRVGEPALVWARAIKQYCKKLGVLTSVRRRLHVYGRDVKLQLASDKHFERATPRTVCKLIWGHICRVISAGAIALRVRYSEGNLTVSCVSVSIQFLLKWASLTLDSMTLQHFIPYIPSQE